MTEAHSPIIFMSNIFKSKLLSMPSPIQTQTRQQLAHMLLNVSHASHSTQSLAEFTELHSHHHIHETIAKKVFSLAIHNEYLIIAALLTESPREYVLLWIDIRANALQFAQCLRIAQYQNQVLCIPADDAAPETTFIHAGYFAGWSTKDLEEYQIPKKYYPQLVKLHNHLELSQFLQNVSVEMRNHIINVVYGPTIGSDSGKESDADDDHRVTRVMVMTADTDVANALAGSFEHWQLFLHPSQLRIVRGSYPMPIYVAGGPGTGKTIIGIHRARYLAATVFTGPEDRILLAGSTEILTRNLSHKLDAFKEHQQPWRSRVLTMTIHQLASDIMTFGKRQFNIASDDEAKELMYKAIEIHEKRGLSLNDYLSEWTDVVQVLGVETEEDYIAADPKKRGKRIHPNVRKDIWLVLTSYRDILASQNLWDWHMICRTATQMIVTGKVHLPYTIQSAIIDEAQALNFWELQLVLALTGRHPDNLMLLGDNRQRVTLRGDILRTIDRDIFRRTRRLRKNYRNTQEIWDVAQKLDLNQSNEVTGEMEDAPVESLFTGVPPQIHEFDNYRVEMETITREIQMLHTDGFSWGEIAILCFKKDRIKEYSIYLKSIIPTQTPKKYDVANDAVFLGTFADAAGLEFRACFLAGCTTIHDLPEHIQDLEEREDHQEKIDHEKRLYYVATSRPREYLWLSGPKPLVSYFRPLLA